jgi:AraC-like DNA-binding protein
MVATTSPTTGRSAGSGIEGDVDCEMERLLPAGGAVRTTQDVDAASTALSECYAELDLRVPHTTGPFSMRLECVDLPDVQLAMLDLSNASAHTVPYPAYTVCFPVRGRVRVRVSADASCSAITGASGVVVCPCSGEVEAEYPGNDCRVFTVTVGRDALERELEAMLGRTLGTPIRFDFALDVARCGSLRRSLALVGSELDDPCGILGHPLTSAVTSRRLSRLLMSGLLIGQHHDWSDELERPAGFEGPHAIRLAVAAIEQHPAELMTVTDVARTANLSVRALEDGFRRHVGTTPMAYVRRVRLARAHDELAEADPESTTAMTVAQRWGFVHYGRFAAQYRQRFGCSPAETLRGT